MDSHPPFDRYRSVCARNRWARPFSRGLLFCSTSRLLLRLSFFYLSFSPLNLLSLQRVSVMSKGKEKKTICLHHQRWLVNGTWRVGISSLPSVTKGKLANPLLLVYSPYHTSVPQTSDNSRFNAALWYSPCSEESVGDLYHFALVSGKWKWVPESYEEESCESGCPTRDVRAVLTFCRWTCTAKWPARVCFASWQRACRLGSTRGNGRKNRRQRTRSLWRIARWFRLSSLCCADWWFFFF